MVNLLLGFFIYSMIFSVWGKDIFQEVFDADYAARFEAAGIEYFYTLIDDAASDAGSASESAS